MYCIVFLSFWFVTFARAVATGWESEECTGVSLLQHSVPKLRSNLNSEVQTYASSDRMAQRQGTDATEVDFIIGTGPPKTATSTLRDALELLGRHAAHGSTMFSQAFDPSFEAVFHDDNVPAIETILREGYNATAGDSPWCFMYEDLMRMKPEYKVIMSVHPGGPDAWVESTHTWNEFHQKLVYPLAPPPGERRRSVPRGFAGRKITDFPPERVNEHLYASKLDCFINETHNQTWRDRCKQGYLAHYDKVRRTVPQERLLEFNVSDGWAPLCSFLGLPVPDMPFPDVNDRTNGHPGRHPSAAEKV